MNSRKRQAPESLLPLRLAKHRRTTLHNPAGGNTTPSQFEGIVSIYMMAAKKWVDRAGDSVMSAVEDLFGGSSVPQRRFGAKPGPTSAGRGVHTAKTNVSNTRNNHSALPRRPPIPMLTADDSMAPPPLPSHPLLPDQSHQPFDTQSTTDIDAVPFPPSTASYASTSWHPQLDDALAASARRTGSSGLSDTSSRAYQSRRHIHIDRHKTRLQEELQKDREAMIKELYALRRKNGYRSDYKTFKGFLDYRERLEMLEGREMLSPSPSLTDLRSARFPSTSNRRHSFPDRAFLERALERARNTLNEPKPLKPFVPSFEQLKLASLAKDQEIERRLHGLPSHLPAQDEASVDALLKKSGTCVSKISNAQVSEKDLSRLRPCQWLNDEIINFYGAMILARSEASKENPTVNGIPHNRRKKPLNAHYFVSFFWTNLKDKGYEKARLAKWTKKFDLFQKEVVLIPINHNNSHWTAAAINFRKKRIEQYDSMGMAHANVFKLLRVYLNSEHMNKRKKPFDFTGWEDYVLDDTPQQENGYDCGVFTCQFLEALSRGEETFSFTQRDMPYFRRRMIWEIGHGKLREDP